MKSKVILFILAATGLGVTYYLSPNSSNRKPDASQQATFSSMSCTVAKFMLGTIDSTQQVSPLFENLGNLHFKITTTDEKAQTFFDQGLKLTYAFNHAEAHRSFVEASRLDPKSPMTYWGQAYTLGPNINDNFPDDERKKKSNSALAKAMEFSAHATKKEQALIKALTSRYSEDLNASIGDLNVSYMNAMTEVLQKFPDDPDVLTLYAVAVMNTMPWNYWDIEGNPSPNILEAKAALEKAIEINPDHAGAHHYYIHLVELPKPDLAIESADKLGSLMPAAGHIVHMPSHIYIRVGRYLDAMKVNEEAILADEDYISQCYAQGMYPLAYYPHNLHFLWSAASLLGASEKAINAAKKTAEKVPAAELVALPFLQDFASTPLLAYTRFGKWNQILTTPKPGDDYKHLKVIWHYARGIAFLRKSNNKEAQEELTALSNMVNDPELEHIIANITNSTLEIAKVAHNVLAGEVAMANGNTNKAHEYFEKAVILEDALIYSEPAAWHIPTRQTLGAFLLEQKKYTEAEKVYRKDLQILRQNGWSLMGLYQSLKAQGKTKEANMIKKEFDQAWQHSDIDIQTSIL